MNLEEKEKFFAQYWGQEVGIINEANRHKKFLINESNMHCAYLELTPLSQIIDEDLLKISRMNFLNSDIRNVGANEFLFWYDVRGANKGRWFHKSDYWGNLNTHQSDYLRSKGYALPWLGISVEEHIKRGWVKLK